MNPEPPGDFELLQRLRRGDEAAFLELYRRRQGAIYRFALHLSGSPSAAEDIVQEVFIALLRGDLGFNPERGTLSGYLFGIARKQALRLADRARLDCAIDGEAEESSLPQLAVEADPLKEFTHRESLEALKKAIAALPRRYREVVVLCDLEEVDYADAAAALGCPIGTVRSRLHRARALLLEKLNKERPKPALGALKPARCTP